MCLRSADSLMKLCESLHKCYEERTDFLLRTLRDLPLPQYVDAFITLYQLECVSAVAVAYYITFNK